jgi:hypothetical protein
MRTRQFIATALVASMAVGTSTSLLAGAQGNVTMAGTAKDEAKKPFPDYSARAREVEKGQIVNTTPLDEKGNFSFANMQPNKYVIELLDKGGRVVCTEGPFDMTKQPVKNNIEVDCDKVPVAWWLLGAAAAAGVTAGVVTGDPTSPAN